MGSGSKTQVIQPTPAAQPSTAEGIREYVKSLPALFQAQLDFAPKEAAQQVELAQQFAEPLGRAQLAAQEALFPGTTALQEQLVQQVNQGIADPFSAQEKQAIISDLNAQLGRNVGGGAGDVFTAKAFAGERFNRQQQFRNLGLSLAGRQPLAQPTNPNFTNQLGSFTPGQALGVQSANYGSFLGASRPLLGSKLSDFERNAGVISGIGQGLAGLGSI